MQIMIQMKKCIMITMTYQSILFLKNLVMLKHVLFYTVNVIIKENQ